MRSLLSRSTRLTSSVLKPQFLHPSAPLIRRGFANSVVGRQHDQNSDIATKASSSSLKDLNKQDDRPTKKPSRLAALKKRSQNVNTSEMKSKGGEAGQRYILGQSADKPIRTRFAPSPTGYLHLGSLRTALFNNLVAKATKGGDFIIRIEDTDQNRLVSDAEERIFKDLEWAGLEWNEGPDKGGPYGPYRQSERLEIYKEHTQTLLDDGSAYRCFCDHSTLEAQKRALHDAGKSTAYPGTCRSISRSESDERASKGEDHIVRLDSARFGTPKFKDAIYGPFQKKEPEEDFVLMKRDGYPTYHLANVVDDHLMKITHVIRGEEWLISTPKHLALYEAFGWEPPTFAHLGLLVSNNGSKLSKRDDSVNLSMYMEQNVFPMALQAWLANLGASLKKDAKTPRTLNDVAENLTYKFTRGGIKLNPDKLDFFQHEYRNLLAKTPVVEHTSRERDLVRDYLVIPLVKQVDSITASSKSPSSDYMPIQPTGTCLYWPAPLTPVPAMVSSESSQPYALNIILQETVRYTSVANLARLLPYFFWRPPPEIYRAAIVTQTPRRDLIDLVNRTLLEVDDWGTALDRLFDSIPSDEAPSLHAVLRLIAIGDSQAVGKSSRILFNVLGQDEWRVRANLVRSLLDEMESGGSALRQDWLDEKAILASEAESICRRYAQASS
ncbi:Glutamyl-tRNA synthetase [Fusarium austroafricanum]|uniref:Glutamate--tRNA ligase, mitochondrial n=1 Tax=Fusarium austroafricanum TaxID=2364996 RepID=A0A8H4KP46_9HYPO|nr:Glutamyl-tRNA synthetase [Fusarium austroafricanum]